MTTAQTRETSDTNQAGIIGSGISSTDKDPIDLIRAARDAAITQAGHLSELIKKAAPGAAGFHHGAPPLLGDDYANAEGEIEELAALAMTAGTDHERQTAIVTLLQKLSTLPRLTLEDVVRSARDAAVKNAGTLYEEFADRIAADVETDTHDDALVMRAQAIIDDTSGAYDDDTREAIRLALADDLTPALELEALVRRAEAGETITDFRSADAAPRRPFVEPEITPIESPDAAAAEVSPLDRLRALVDESLESFNHELSRLIERCEGEAPDRDDLARPATHLLRCLFTRIQKEFPVNPHDYLGYNRERSEIRHNLDRIYQTVRVSTRSHRLDELLEGLVHESRMLVEAQSVFCEHCEHCLREHPEQREYEMQTESSLEPKELDYVIERFIEDDLTDGDNLVLLLKHIDSMVWVSRPGAVREVVERVVDGIAGQSFRRSEHVTQYVENSLKRMRERLQLDETGGDE